MKKIYFILLILLLVTFFVSAFSLDELNIEIIYPKNGQNVNAPSTFIIGNTKPGAKMSINGENIKIFDNGGFVKVVKLNRGKNQIKIVSNFRNSKKEIIHTINVPQSETTIPKYPLKFDQKTIKPNKEVWLKSGDVLEVEFKGSTGHKASFSIGKKNISMIEQPPSFSKTQTVFGKSFYSSDKPVKGIYKGFYKIKSTDKFKNTPISIKLKSKRGTKKVLSGAKLTKISNKREIIGKVVKDNAVTRVYPAKSRLTPLRKGTKLYITGKMQNYFRFKMGDKKDGWISSNDIVILSKNNGIPKNFISSLNIESSKNQIKIKMPVSEKTPVLIKNPEGSTLLFNIYNSIADIDVFSQPKDKFIKEIKYSQPYKDIFQLSIKVNSKNLWGYNYYYDNGFVVLALKKSSIADKNHPLKDKIITIDPGHGGSELGSVGPTGIPEKDVNLGISKYLASELTKRGAKVILTRTDDKFVGLYDRTKIAQNSNTDILLSIHNNALPSGRNPYKEHGSSVYYYNSQSLPLAKSIQTSMIKDLGFNDYGVFWSSLVLTRPYEYIAVLIEVGFMINPYEYNLLIKPEFQKKAANSIVKGLEDFLSQSESL